MPPPAEPDRASDCTAASERNHIYVNQYLTRHRNPHHRTRLTILVVLAASAAIASVVPSATINDFGFLSMGLRGSVVFIPMNCALFCPGRVDRRFAMASIICGPVAVLVGNFIGLPFDPLFLGLAVVLVLTLLGAVAKRSYVKASLKA